MRLLPLALGVLWPAIAIAGSSEEELAFPAAAVQPKEEELVATIVHTPRFPGAEDAVRTLLLQLHREDRNDEARQWVERLVDDPVITFRRADLAGRLRAMQLQFIREDAESIERDAVLAKTQAAFQRCADIYDGLIARLENASEVPRDWRSFQLDQVRYHGGVCSEHAGHPFHAIELYSAVSADSVSLGQLAMQRFARLLGALPQISASRAIGAPLANVEMQRRIVEYDFSDIVIE